ncbi:hypothetical protein [Sinorhizobium fredii]|uniref:hypothetical protein n=1 Tax=Rhizobium fredii TaxID=380 RepID=UPI003CE4900F
MAEEPSTNEAAHDRDLLKRLIISHADLQMALSAITFLCEIDDDATYGKVELRRFKCYETTFVVSYGRAFTKNRGTKFPVVPLKRIGVDLTPSERTLHESILDLRHKVYAHSDEAFTHVRLDMHEMDIGGKTLRYPHFQFDHGLEFAELFKRIATVELTRKIMDGLYDTVQTLGKSMPDSFMYITPTAAAD